MRLKLGTASAYWNFHALCCEGSDSALHLCMPGDVQSCCCCLTSSKIYICIAILYTIAFPDELSLKEHTDSPQLLRLNTQDVCTTAAYMASAAL